MEPQFPDFPPEVSCVRLAEIFGMLGEQANEEGRPGRSPGQAGWLGLDLRFDLHLVRASHAFYGICICCYGQGGWSGSRRHVGGEDVVRVTVEILASPVVTHRGTRIGMPRGNLDIPQVHARIQTAVMNACRSVCGPTDLLIPARRATRRTMRPARCRSRRRPSAARKTGPSVRSPMARSIARAVRGASGIVTTLPPLR